MPNNSLLDSQITFLRPIEPDLTQNFKTPSTSNYNIANHPVNETEIKPSHFSNLNPSLNSKDEPTHSPTCSSFCNLVALAAIDFTKKITRKSCALFKY